jgi:hypothetical protein
MEAIPVSEGKGYCVVRGQLIVAGLWISRRCSDRVQPLDGNMGPVMFQRVSPNPRINSASLIMYNVYIDTKQRSLFRKEKWLDKNYLFSSHSKWKISSSSVAQIQHACVSRLPVELPSVSPASQCRKVIPSRRIRHEVKICRRIE